MRHSLKRFFLKNRNKLAKDYKTEKCNTTGTQFLGKLLSFERDRLKGNLIRVFVWIDCLEKQCSLVLFPSTNGLRTLNKNRNRNVCSARRRRKPMQQYPPNQKMSMNELYLKMPCVVSAFRNDLYFLDVRFLKNVLTVQV